MTRTFAFPIVLFAVACQHHAAGDGGDSSSFSTTSDEDNSGTVAPTTIGSTAVGDSSESGDTSGGDSDAYGGEWCGNLGTGTLAMGTTAYVIPFAGAGTNPIPIVAWVDDTGQLSTARYDIASATWSDPEVIATDFPSEDLKLSRYPVGAIAGNGDALIGYGTPTPAPHIVVQRFDASTQTWAREDLPDMFNDPMAIGALLGSSGAAALWARDIDSRGSEQPATVWFFDPAGQMWTVGPSADPGGFAETTIGAIDPVLGDMMLAETGEAGLITTWHFVAAEGQAQLEDIQTANDSVSYLLPLGAGGFAIIAYDFTFDGPFELHAHRFDGAQWQASETLGGGDDFPALHAVGDGKGRIGVAWTDSGGGAYEIELTPDAGWGQPFTLQAVDPSSPGAVSSQRIVLEDASMFAVWAGWSSGRVSPRSSHFDRRSWSASTELDPSQNTEFAAMISLDSLGSDRARATWNPYEVDGAYNYFYACHAPSSGWSAPVAIAQPLLVEPHPDAEVLVVTRQGLEGTAQYFAAMR